MKQQQQGPPGLAILAQLGQAGLMQDPMEQMKGIMGLLAAINQMENSDATLALNQQEAENRNDYQTGMLDISRANIRDQDSMNALRRAGILAQLLQVGLRPNNDAMNDIFGSAGMSGLWDPQQGGMPQGMSQEDWMLRQHQQQYQQQR
jgi:hypothetical protein